MSKLNNFIIKSVKSCLVLNLILNLKSVTSSDEEMYDTVRTHELTKDVPLTSLYYKINSINDKHFDITAKQIGGKKQLKVSRFLRNNPEDDQFEILINTEDSLDDYNQNNKELGDNYKEADNIEKFDFHINTVKADAKDRLNHDYTIDEISHENYQLDNVYQEKENFDTGDIDLDDDSGQYKDYIDTNINNHDVLEKNDHDTDELDDGGDYNVDLKSPYYDDSDDYDSKSLYQDNSDDDSSREEENDEPSKIFVIHPEDIQKFLNNYDPENLQTLVNKDITVNGQNILKGDKPENVFTRLNKDKARNKIEDTVNLPIILEPLLQFQEQIHTEDNDKYEIRHESYKNQYDQRIKSNPESIHVENRERSNKINSMYQKAQVKLKDINWLDILNKTVPIETDSESSEALTYREKPTQLHKTLKYDGEYQNQDVSKLVGNLLKYNDKYRNKDVTDIDVLDKLEFVETMPIKSKDYKISNKANVLEKLNFLDTIPTISKNPDDKNSVLLLNDINHLLHNTPISRNAQKYAFPQLVDILLDSYLLTVKVKNFIKEIHSLRNQYYGNIKDKSAELFKYYEFDHPRDFHGIYVEELAAMLIQDIHAYMKRIYSPSTRHEIIKKLGVINKKVKSVKTDLMKSLEQSMRKREEMSEKLKNNKLLKEHFRKNWSDSIKDLFGESKHTNSFRKQNQEEVLKEGVPQDGTLQKEAQQEQVPQEGTLKVEAPQENAEQSKPTEDLNNDMIEKQPPNDINPKDSKDLEIMAQEKENENPKVNKEEITPTENKPIEEPNISETEKKEGKDKKGTNNDAVTIINEDKVESKDKQAVIKEDVVVETTTEKGTTKGSTKKYRLPVYGLFDYWTYKKTVVEDDCPEGTAKLKNECIRLPPH